MDIIMWSMIVFFSKGPFGRVLAINLNDYIIISVE